MGGGRGRGAAAASNTFEAMYEQSVDSVLHGTGRETFEAVEMLQVRPIRRSTRPRLAQIIRADVLATVFARLRN